MPTQEPVFAIDDLKCQLCPLWKTSISGAVRRSGVYGRGTGSNGLLVVAEAQGAQEINMGLPLLGDGGELLARAFNTVGIKENESYITCTTRCRPPGNRIPSADEYKTCLAAHATKDLPSKRPTFVLLLGATALRAIGGKPKLTENRGQIFPCTFYGDPAIPTLATYHPKAILMKPALYDVWLSDLQKAMEHLIGYQRPSTLPVHTKVYVKSFTQLKLYVDYINKYHPDVAVDLETTGLIFWKELIASFSLTFEMDGQLISVGTMTIPKPGWWHVDLPHPEIRDLLCPMFSNSDTKFTFHNGDFDTKFLWKNGVFVRNDFDTIDAHLMLDENTSHGLKDLTGRFIPEMAGYEHSIKDQYVPGDMWQAAPEQLLGYNMDDTFATTILKNQFHKRIVHDHLENFFVNHAMPTRRSFTRMSYRGIMVNVPRVKEKSATYRARVKKLESDLFSAVGKKFKWSSSAALGEVLFGDLKLPILATTAKGAPSTNKEVLKELGKKHPVPKMAVEMKHLQKMISTYLDGDIGDGKPKGGMLQYVDDMGRIHADFLTHGTTSGRPSAKAPSLLTIPRDPDIRMNFCAPPGWKLIDLDFSQAELVLLAFLAQDPKLIEAVSSKDMHVYTARTMMKIVGEITKEIRNRAKTVNFRKAYRGGSDGAAEQLGLTEREAKEWFEKWDRTFYKVPLWWQEQERQWREVGIIEGIYGRKRHFPPAFDQKTAAYYDRLSANFPCQNGVADTTNRSLYLIDAALDAIFGWTLSTLYKIPGIVLSVHDSIILEAPDDLAEDVRDIAMEIMSQPLPVINTSLRVDAHIIQAWSENEQEQEEKIVIDDIREELRDDQRVY